MKELENQPGAVEKAWRFVGRGGGSPAEDPERRPAGHAGGPARRRWLQLRRSTRPAAEARPGKATQRKQPLSSGSPNARAVPVELEVAQATAGRRGGICDKSIKSIDCVDAAKKAADEFRQLADAGRNMAGLGPVRRRLRPVVPAADEVEPQAYAKAAGLSTEQLAGGHRTAAAEAALCAAAN